MQVRVNNVKQSLAAGGVIYSSSVRLPEPGLCEILGYAGFDFVLLDGEHGAVDASALDRMVQGCFAGGTSPVYRVLRNGDPHDVMRALDLGVQGVLIPHCVSAADVAALRQAALYAPHGNRGFGPGRGAIWGRIPASEYFSQANREVLLLALVEDPEGVERIDEIAAAGLDVIWVGTGDLACAYGVPGETDHALVHEAAKKILAACQKHNVAAGWPARRPEDAAWAREQGYRAIGFGCAEQYVMQRGRQFLEAVGR